jgi:hypothetical protein
MVYWNSTYDGVVKGRVELLKTLAPKQLPVGSKGTLLEGRLDEPGMVVVQWDAGFVIPMYRNEIKAL